MGHLPRPFPPFPATNRRFERNAACLCSPALTPCLLVPVCPAADTRPYPSIHPCRCARVRHHPERPQAPEQVREALRRYVRPPVRPRLAPPHGLPLERGCQGWRQGRTQATEGRDGGGEGVVRKGPRSGGEGGGEGGEGGGGQREGRGGGRGSEGGDGGSEGGGRGMEGPATEETAEVDAHSEQGEEKSQNSPCFRAGPRIKGRRMGGLNMPPHTHQAHHSSTTFPIISTVVASGTNPARA